MKKILVLFVCLSALLLFATCTEASVEVYYDGMFTGKYVMNNIESIGGISGSVKFETDFALHTFGGRVYLLDRLLLGAEIGTGEIKKNIFFVTQDLETTSYIVGYKFNINEFLLIPFISIEEMNMRDSLNNRNRKISGIFPGVEAKVPLSDRLSIEGSYRLSLFFSAYELNGQDMVNLIHEDLRKQNITITSSIIKISALSFKARYLITENIALVGGYKKNMTEIVIEAKQDPLGAKIPSLNCNNKCNAYRKNHI